MEDDERIVDSVTALRCYIADLSAEFDFDELIALYSFAAELRLEKMQLVLSEDFKNDPSGI